ncbi:MAG: FGGY family carbohydrate kinase, partial [Oscillospiraceae bacterium]
MKYLIGIDIGTSSTKTVLFDTLGNTIASSSAEYPMYQPQNGWAEQRPEDWWNATVSTLKQVTKEVNPSDIVGVGLAGQMHGLVMLNEGG